ncbi:MAG TPA: MFS transporter [Acetobacteraceae bacterium]|nr:MFS transporter [Acetobacteraceae bacterium]
MPGEADAGGGAGTRNGRGGPSLRALDWLNFFLADVQSGLGPFLGIFLVTARHWNAASIGIVMTLAGVATLVAQTPAGALIDATRAKRLAIMLAAGAISAGALFVTLVSGFGAVAGAQILIGAAAAIFPPATAAIALGLVGPERFTHRMGRMQGFNHAGNVVAASLAGGLGYLIATAAVFWVVSALGILAIAAATFINPRRIDHRLARGFTAGKEEAGGNSPSGFRTLFTCRPLLIFIVAVTLWQLANAAMLPVMGQKLAIHHKGEGALFMAALIVVAQAVMVPMSVLVGHRADRWGRKALFLAGFAALPLRGLLFGFASLPYHVIMIQALDGVGAGIFGALFPLVIADLTRGTGRYNVTLGAATTIQGIGAAFSTTLAGYVITGFGYRAAFLALAAIALAALLIFLFLMPETGPGRGARSQGILAESGG